MKTNLTSDLPAQKTGRINSGFFCLEVCIMIQPCQDDGAICLYVFTHYNYYILKYRIDLSDCIFSSLKLSCKKDLVLPWNVLPLIVIQSQITNKAQSCFSLKANDPTSCLVPDRIIQLNIFGIWDDGKRQEHLFCLPSGYKFGIPNYPLELPTPLSWIYTEPVCLYHSKPWYASVTCL